MNRFLMAGASALATASMAAGGLLLAGIAVYGPRNAVDKVCRGLILHP